MPTGTDNDDYMLFRGQLTQLTVTLINPYSDAVVDIDDEYKINSSAFHGGGGRDTLEFSDFGDALFIVNAQMQQMVTSFETFIAGNGGDVIVLAHETIVYNDVTIFGGEGDDILWSNVGNDVLVAAGGDDIVDAGPGNDEIYGEDGNDSLNGGDGNDYINGGMGNDILFGGHRVAPVVHDKDFADTVIFPHLMEGVNIADLMPPGTSALGTGTGNLHVGYEAQATLTFREGFAGYNNTLGIYGIAADGTITAASILWENTKTAALDTAHVIDLPVGAEGGNFGFFIIADGDRVNSGYGGLDVSGEGHIRFIYDYGLASERAATIYDMNSRVKIVYDDGITERVLNGADYHTTERGGSTLINHDGAEHVVTGLVDIGQHDVLRIGFEDLPNRGDADYEDVFFDLNINEIIAEGDSEDGADILIGGAGDDILYAQDGNDILVVGEGMDDIYGGRGNDRFVFDVLDHLVDTIHDFETGAGKDILNITDILTGYDPLTDLIADFVQVEALNGDTHVRINADGDHGGIYTAMAIMTGVETTLADLIANGNIVANQHVSV
jgi:Ca2+-binding RTX toxin-like protein